MLAISAILNVIVAAAALAQTGPGITREGPYWVQVLRTSVDGRGIRGLRVSSWGDITIQGADTDQVSFTLKKKVRARTEAEAERLMQGFRRQVMRHGGVLYLGIDCEARRRAFPELELRIPRTMAKSYLETRGGNIDARQLDGSLVATSGGGNIRADEIGGSLRAQTMGGEIWTGKVGGVVECISGAGNVTIEDAGGEVWTETAGGEIVIKTAAGPVYASSGGGNIRVVRTSGAVSARTLGGVIEILRADGKVVAETGSGAIVVNAAASVECQSAGGAIRLKGIAGPVRATTASGNIIAEFRRGESLAGSYLETGLGDVTVLIPSNLAVTVKAHNQPAGRVGRILSEFPGVEVHRVGSTWFEPILAEGPVNGGGPLLNVSVTGGSVYLRRR